ncbi:MAG: hypothetical protein KC468_21500, partial [Myxococcales bacterium]|nr:hypothetical protein [Myxococcales bacterium]
MPHETYSIFTPEGRPGAFQLVGEAAPQELVNQPVTLRARAVTRAPSTPRARRPDALRPRDHAADGPALSVREPA